MQILPKQAGKIPITEEVVEAAASNWKSGEAVMQLLLLRQDAEITIKEDAAMIIISRWIQVLSATSPKIPSKSSGPPSRELLVPRTGFEVTRITKALRSSYK
jgi:hypothetical protein